MPRRPPEDGEQVERRRISSPRSNVAQDGSNTSSLPRSSPRHKTVDRGWPSEQTLLDDLVSTVESLQLRIQDLENAVAIPANNTAKKSEPFATDCSIARQFGCQNGTFGKDGEQV